MDALDLIVYISYNNSKEAGGLERSKTKKPSSCLLDVENHTKEAGERTIPESLMAQEEEEQPAPKKPAASKKK